MSVDDFELPGLCQICAEDLASVYVVISRARFTAKAHVCFACFGELEECGGRWVEPVSLQEFKEVVETDGSSEECGVRIAGMAGSDHAESLKSMKEHLPPQAISLDQPSV